MFQKSKIKPCVAALLIGTFIGGGFGVGCASLKTGDGDSPELKTPAIGDVSEARNTPVVRAAQAVGPAVVGITNKTRVRDWFNREKLVEQGTGSGVIIDAKGYIVTNNHVVQGAQEIVVSFADGTTAEGKVLGTDPATDLAVVKVDADNLHVAQLGDSDSLLVGEPAIAIGNPLGLEFQGTVTSGVISALNRSIEIGERKFKLIQTDAAINPGNSGGALVNADGYVIGINSAKIAASGVEGIGLAIPINTVRPIVKELIENGHVARPYLGVSVMDKRTAMYSGYPYEIQKGVVVANVVDGGPAKKAGVLRGDIIIRIGEKSVDSFAELREGLELFKINDKVELGIIRENKPMSITIKLEEMPTNG